MPDALLTKVKARAYRNIKDCNLDNEHAARLFDAEVGSLHDAIAAKTLHARFFAPAPPPAMPERTIKSIIPTQPGYKVMRTRSGIDYGHVQEEHDQMGRTTWCLDVVNFAQVPGLSTTTAPWTSTTTSWDAAVGTPSLRGLYK